MLGILNRGQCRPWNQVFVGGSGFGVQRVGFGVLGLGFRVSGFRVLESGFGFEV